MATTIITADQGFDQTYYLQAKAAQLTSTTGTSWSAAQVLAAITAAGLTPAQHYSLYGYNEGLSPNAYFNASQYATSKAAAAGISVTDFELAWYQASGSTNLYLHYIQYGAFEDNVSPSTGFDDYSYYVAKAAQMGSGTTWQQARDAIQAAGLNAISHYILYGVSESLAYTPTSSSISGQTFTLTTNTDIINGGAGNDLVIGDWSTTTVNASDQINGGGGTDTLKIYGALGTNALPATVSNIEIVDLVSPGTNVITDTAIGLPTGVTKLRIEQASTTTSGTITTTSLSGLTLELGTLNGASTAGTITWAANTTDTTLNLELSGFQSATAAGNLKVTGAAATTMNIVSDTAANGVATLTLPTSVTAINVNAATNLTVKTGLVSTAAKTVTVSGTGRVSLNGTANNLANTLTVDGTNNSGGVLFQAEAGSTLTFKGGSGNDTATFTAGDLTTADTLTGGAGTDTLAINDTVLNTVGGLAAVNAATSFEILSLNTTAASLDMALLTNGINSVAIGKDLGTNNATMTNSKSTTTYTIDNSIGNLGTVSIGNLAGQTGTTVTLDSGAATTAQTLVALTITGATAVSLTSTGTGTGGSNAITTFNSADNAVITLAGSKDLAIGSATAGTGGIVVTGTTGVTLDATNFGGKLSAMGSAQADIITGSAQADTLNGGAGKDTITGGAGNDTLIVTTAAQADILTGGTGADTFKFTGSAGGMFATSGGSTDIVHITDFVAGTDKISLNNSAGVFTSASLTSQTITTAETLTQVWSQITTVGKSTAGGAVNCVLVTVSNGAAAGTYLYANDTTTAAVDGADMLVNLTGITGTLSVGDITFA